MPPPPSAHLQLREEQSTRLQKCSLGGELEVVLKSLLGQWLALRRGALPRPQLPRGGPASTCPGQLVRLAKYNAQHTGVFIDTHTTHCSQHVRIETFQPHTLQTYKHSHISSICSNSF